MASLIAFSILPKQYNYNDSIKLEVTVSEAKYDLPLVSVNITTYNRCKNHLVRCLNSVLKQSYSNLEIIVVDDCSKDNTVKVLSEFVKSHQQIKFFVHKVNMGNAHARNTALRHSKGKYIAFMDDDDEWIDCKKLEKQVKIFESDSTHNLGILFSNVKIDRGGGDIQDKRIKVPANFNAHIMRRNGVIYSPTVMTKRKILEEVGGFDTALKRGVDSEFYRSCTVLHGYNVQHMLDITTTIHIHAGARLTPTDTRLAKINFLHNQLHVFKKYNVRFVFHPLAFVYRIWLIISLLK